MRLEQKFSERMSFLYEHTGNPRTFFTERTRFVGAPDKIKRITNHSRRSDWQDKIRRAANRTPPGKHEKMCIQSYI